MLPPTDQPVHGDDELLLSTPVSRKEASPASSRRVSSGRFNLSPDFGPQAADKAASEAPLEAPSRPPLQKSYDNREWIHSRGARLLRIMAEFMETGDKLKANRVMGTLLFFGSARIRSPEQWAAEVADLEEQLSGLALPDSERDAAEVRLNNLRRQKELCHYYDKTTQLAARLTEWSHTEEAEAAVRQSLSKMPFFFEKGGASSAFPSNPLSQSASCPRWSPSGLVVCSGGGPGMMEAANKGAAQVPEGRSMGMGISLPFEKSLNRYVSDELAFTYHYFFTRKFWMVYMAMGVVATPGGVGTLDELMEILTLRQTGRFKTKIPIVLFGERFWRTLVNFEFLRDQGLISDSDYDLLFWTDSVDDAFKYIVNTLQGGENAYPGPKAKH